MEMHQVDLILILIIIITLFEKCGKIVDFHYPQLDVKELTYGDASSRFDFNTHNHYHVICEKCGKIVDFHYPQLDEVEQLTAYHRVRRNTSPYGNIWYL